MAINTLKEITECPLNKRGDVLCVRTVEASGRTMIDVRKFYTNDADELAPTSKGVMLEPKVWAAILTGLIDEVTAQGEVVAVADPPAPKKAPVAKRKPVAR